MVGKLDISTTKLEGWDLYKNKLPDEVLASVYAHIEATSLMMCGWYWSSIRTKRRTSIWVRALAFVLLLFGTTFPIFAALQAAAEHKLLLTQLAVAFLAIAGLTQLADRVFGWSSGWMRYITTVTTMENLTRAFQLEWAKYLVSKSDPLSADDAKSLFDLAKALEQELIKLQAEETTKWVAEFNSGVSLLEAMIKSQREETDKKLEAVRTSLESQDAALKVDGKSKVPGALEVALSFKNGASSIKISLDEEPFVEFLGSVWARTGISPGQHIVRFVTSSIPVCTIERVAEIKAESLTRLEVAVGN